MSSSVANPHGPLDSPHVNHLPSRCYRFGNVEVDFQFAEVRRSGVRIRVQDQPLQILAALLTHPGNIVSREELRKVLWDGETFVDFDHCLNSAVKRLRDVLHDDPDHPRLIETVPRHGYRFIAPVTEIAPVAQGSMTVRDGSGGRLTVPTQPQRERSEAVEAGRRRFAHMLLILLTVVLATGAIALAIRILQARAHATASAGRTMIAVLPFRDLGDDASGSSMAAGITQELITEVGKMSPGDVAVLAVPVGQYSVAGKSAPRSAKEIGANYVVEGTTRVQGSAVRISVQLVRVSDQNYVWAESYDKELRDSLTVQRYVAGAVTSVLAEKLSAEKRRGD